MAWNDPGQWSWLNFRPPIEAMQQAWQIGVSNAAIGQRAEEGRRQDLRQKEAMAIRQSDIDEQRAYHDSLIRLQQEKANRLQTGVQSFQNALTSSGPATQDPIELKNRALNWTIQNPWMMADDDVAQALRPAISSISELARQKEELLQQKVKADASSIHGARVKEAIDIVGSLPANMYANFLKANGGDPSNMTDNGMTFAFQARELLKTEAAIQKRDEEQAQRDASRAEALARELASEKAMLDAVRWQRVRDPGSKDAEKWDEEIRTREQKIRGLAAQAGFPQQTATPEAQNQTEISGAPVLKISKDPQSGKAIWSR